MNSEYIKRITALWQDVVEGKKKLDPVDPDELKGKHADRDDKDIDNDGDVDSSDEYLHKRRKAVKKAMAKEDIDEVFDSLSEEQLDEISAKLARKAAASSAAKSFEYGSSAYGPGTDKEADRLDKKADKARAHVQKRQGDKGVKKVDKMTGKLIYGRNESVDLDTKSVDKALTHDCAKHVTSEQWGFGECISGQHTLVENEDGTATVTHYDVMFEHGVEFDVPVEDLDILVSESHKHTAKKKMKESKQPGQSGAKAETMKDKRKGKAADDMAKDHDADNPELAKDDAQGHEDATKAGRAVKGQAPARPGEKRMGDTKIINPVKGAVTSTTGKEG